MTLRIPKKRLRGDYNFGFVVLCPEKNVDGLNTTVTSIENVYKDFPIVCTVGDNCSDDEFSKMNGICRTVKGGDTITGLINLGVHSSDRPWNVVVFAGSWVRNYLRRKFDLFVKDERDILFPVVDGRYNFVDGSMNGIILHKRAIEEIGDIPTVPMQKFGYDELELIKLFWATTALEKGFKFKAIIGMSAV